MKTFVSAHSHPIKHTVKILTALLLVSPHFAAGKNQSETNYLEDFSLSQFRQPIKTEILEKAVLATFDGRRATKRYEALRGLQDNGFRTNSMLCPILPLLCHSSTAERLKFKS